MAAILPQGKTFFTDTNGAPLAAGSVIFYARGTTSLKSTYADIGLTVPNPNPVTLDASGGAVIWGTGSYTMVVRDSLANQIYSLDTQAPVSTAADIAASLGYTPATAAQGAKADAALSGLYLIPQTTGGTSSAYTITPATPVASYANGQMYCLDPHVAGAANATLSVSGLPVASIMSQANGVLSNVQAGELAQGVPVTVIYSSGQFIITAGDARAKATSLSAAWVSNAAIDPVTTTGTATAYAATSPVLSYADGIEVVVVPHVTSGASPTLALNGLAATAIKYYAGGVLAAVPPGALMIGVPARLVYTSGAWVLLSPRWAVGGDVATVGSVVDASGFIASTKAAANAGGAAPIYAIRARIAFSVSGGVITVMQADNMAVTRSLPGVFAATFTTDMQDANYVVQGCATGDLSASVSRMFTPNLTNNGTAFSLVAPVAHGFSFCTTNTGALIDPTYCYITVSR